MCACSYTEPAVQNLHSLTLSWCLASDGPDRQKMNLPSILR